jgi:hypothetical protein
MRDFHLSQTPPSTWIASSGTFTLAFLNSFPQFLSDGEVQQTDVTWQSMQSILKYPFLGHFAHPRTNLSFLT